MKDLTKITTPYGLLDKETQEALRAHGGPWEYFGDDEEWHTKTIQTWYSASTYRVKPQPSKPREWLMSPSGTSGLMTVNTSTDIEHYQSLGWIHVREVIK